MRQSTDRKYRNTYSLHIPKKLTNFTLFNISRRKERAIRIYSKISRK